MWSQLDRAFFLRLFQLAVPVSLQFLLHSSRYIVDVLMLGRLGEGELAAVGLCTSIHMVANSLIFGLAGGIGLLCAQYFGAKDNGGVTKTVSVGVAVGWMFMLPVAMLFFGASDTIFSFATNEARLVPLGAAYLKITAIVPLLVGTIVGIGAGLNAIGKPHLNLLFTIIAVGVNLFLNWVLIFGNLGAPALGIEGAAIATLCSLLVEILIIFIYLQHIKSSVKISIRLLLLHVTPDNLRSFLHISIPLVVGGAVWHFGAFMYQVAYGHMGELELAAMTMVQPLRLLCFSFFWGISSATGVIMGHLLGANKFDEAFAKSGVLILLGLLASIIAALLVWTFRAPIWVLFGNLDGATIGLAEDVMRIMLLTICILAVNVVGIVGVLQSGADNRFILTMDIFCQWVVGIPLCWLGAFYFNWSLEWVFLAAFSEEIVKLFIWVPRLLSKVWMRNVISA